MVCFADSPRLSCPTFPGPESCIGVILTGDHCTESPFASSGRYPSECHMACDIDRYYSILVAHMGSCARPKPSRSLGVSPVPRVFAGYCVPLLGVGLSRRYLLNLSMGAW